MSLLALVVPCYNEAQRLDAGGFESFVRDRSDVRLCFVNDGSTDGTSDLLKGLAFRYPDRIQVLELKVNSGKAEAVRRGILQAAALPGVVNVGYFDADLAAPLNEAFRLIVHMDQAGAFMAFGSRVKRLGIRLERRGFRHYLGRVFATEASLLLGLPVYDTQCGAKIFRAELAARIFDRPFISRWFFDVEIFFRLNTLYGRARVEREAMEVPLNEWVERGASKVRLADFVAAPLELLRIAWFYREGALRGPCR